MTVTARLGADSQLIGAIVVDDTRKPWNRETDRTFVFGEWDDVLDTKKNIDFNYVVLAINGLRYPPPNGFHIFAERALLGTSSTPVLRITRCTFMDFTSTSLRAATDCRTWSIPPAVTGNEA